MGYEKIKVSEEAETLANYVQETAEEEIEIVDVRKTRSWVDVYNPKSATFEDWLLCVDGLAGAIACYDVATNASADANAYTNRDTDDDDENDTADDASSLLARCSPRPAICSLLLGQLSLSLQVVSAWPNWIDTGLRFVLDKVGLALAGLSFLLGKRLSLEICFERGVNEIDVHLAIRPTFFIIVVLVG